MGKNPKKRVKTDPKRLKIKRAGVEALPLLKNLSGVLLGSFAIKF